MASQSREKHCAQKTNKARLPVESKSSLEIQRLQPSDGPTGSYSEPEVGFGDIAADLREARFWIVSELPTIHPEQHLICCGAFTVDHLFQTHTVEAELRS